MKTRKTTRAIPVLASAVSIFCSLAVEAQELDEIVVTAQKRSASVQDVPLSMTAINGEDARDLGWNTGADALNQVPNVQIDFSNARTRPQFRIRGVGSEDFNVAGQSPVGVYINEVYINNAGGRGVALYDIDRIEVLRGPQGTLWGKNTTAGAIHFVTRTPSFQTDGYGSVRVGSVNGDGSQSSFEGAFGGAVVDDLLAGRVAAKVESGEDWVTNEDPRGEDMGGFDALSVRGSLLWTPIDDLSVLLIGTYTDFEGDPRVGHSIGMDIYGYSERPGIGFNTNQESDSVFTKTEVRNLTLGLEWSLDDWTVNSVTAFNGVESMVRLDDDVSPVHGIFFQSPGAADQISQELRLTSSEDRSLRWIFGAYAFTEDLQSHYDLNFSLVPFNPGDPSGFSVAHIFGQELPPPGAESLVVKSLEDRERNSEALFASAEYDLTEDLSLAVGVRWTWDDEQIDLQLINYWIDDYGTLDFGAPARALAPILTALDVQERASWGEPSGDVTLKWAFSEDSMAYFRYAEGYRAGQFNITNTQPEDFSLVDPEFIDAYEVGLKTSLLDNRLHLNGSVFNYDYSDVQVYIFTEAGSVALLNGDDAEMFGGELEVSFAPVENFDLTAGIGYTDATYGTFVSPAYDRTGNRIPDTPEWTSNLLARYTIPLRSGASIQLQTDWDYRDDYFADVDNTPVGFTGGRTLGNAAVSFRTQSERWLIRAWVTNITDEEYIQGIVLHPVANRATYGMPRTYGVTLEWSME